MASATNTCSNSFNKCVGTSFCPSNVGQVTVSCIACKENCASCSGDSANTATCEGCNPGYYLSSDGSCARCDQSCSTCTGSESSQCKSCDDGKKLSGTFCFACTDGQTDACKCGDSLNCMTCSSSETRKCALCLIPFAIDAAGSCTGCVDGYFKENSQCKKCQSSCKTCSKGSGICNTCKFPQTITIHHGCQNQCKVVEKEGEACVRGSARACGSEEQITSCKCGNVINCLTCSDNKKSCGSCLPGFKLKGDTCSDCTDEAEKIGFLCFLPAPDNPGSNLSGGAVTGIVIGVLALVGAIGGGVAFYFIKKSKR
ncbi:Cysteine-rich membrane protein 1 [Spironucleus salmonicida]|uniref:Cysteine-rich membrane protein 1 n=1 Tax=Spironucleus salmonicida TaxID=348837 RepID=V6LW49_9EUKA|nr:Cysteine-rich membrane protein 1 [Spironucleus salmonicida]|eukprot:EST48790.1 Cysteine-rich membrane protein 1 [Spironucleus salmonicida]